MIYLYILGVSLRVVVLMKYEVLVRAVLTLCQCRCTLWNTISFYCRLTQSQIHKNHRNRKKKSTKSLKSLKSQKNRQIQRIRKNSKLRILIFQIRILSVESMVGQSGDKSKTTIQLTKCFQFQFKSSIRKIVTPDTIMIYA